MRVFDKLMLDLARQIDEAIILVPMRECAITRAYGMADGRLRIEAAEWRRGPRGNRVIGTCTTGCHFIVEYPKAWRLRGRAIFDRIPAPPPELFAEPPELYERPQYRGRK